MTRFFLLTAVLAPALIGCQSTQGVRVALDSPPMQHVTITGGFCVAEAQAAYGLQQATVAGTDRLVYLHATPELVVNDVDIAYVTSDNQGKPVVAVQLSTAGSRKLARITRENLGKTLAVCVDGTVVSLTPIRGPMSDVQAVISGDFSEEQARRIADAILRW